MKKVILTAMTVTTLALALPALAAAPVTKVGIVNVASILEKSPQVATDKEKLKAEYKPRLKKIQAAEKTLQANVEKLKKNGVTMQASDRQALQKKIGQEQQSLSQEQQTFQQDVTTARQKDMSSLLSQLQSTIATVAKKDGYSLVLPKGGVAYADDSMDITDAVQTAFNKAVSDK